jgi:hypothetical protein
VARLGGDEFAVLLEQVREDADAAAVAERVIAALRPAFVVDGRHAFVGTSVGIARGAGARGPAGAAAASDDPVATVLRDADAAMYQAKAQGKGRWALFEPAMHTAAVARLALEGTCATRSPARRGAAPGASCGSSTSRWSSSGRGASSASRRCCAGSTPSAARCRRPSSSRSPRRRG